MVDIAREVAGKYDIAPDFVMPPLAHRTQQVDVDTALLTLTYYDTADRDLLRYRPDLAQSSAQVCIR